MLTTANETVASYVPFGVVQNLNAELLELTVMFAVDIFDADTLNALVALMDLEAVEVTLAVPLIYTLGVLVGSDEYTRSVQEPKYTR